MGICIVNQMSMYIMVRISLVTDFLMLHSDSNHFQTKKTKIVLSYLKTFRIRKSQFYNNPAKSWSLWNYSTMHTKKVILEKLYMLSQIYALSCYKQYNTRLRLVRNSVTSYLPKLNTTPGLYPNMILSPKIYKFEHDKVIDIAYEADS